jgi:hypothetical protein
MKHLFLLIALASSLAIGQAAPKRNTTEQDQKKTTSALYQGAEYMFALATADRFLAAWISDEPDLAESMLSVQLKAGLEGEVESFIASPCPCAYEIGHGKKLRAGSYQFPVVLFRPPAGNSLISMRNSTIVVSRASEDRWAIEKLP